jgi:molybdopterin-guanine dinucleotide biosynthesis protein A
VRATHRRHGRASTVAGIFVGGRGTRMGGRPKGLLEIDGETIVSRWRRIFAAVGVPCVLVGTHDAYASLGVPMLRDMGDYGPMAGLEALCHHAKSESAKYAVAVACDMPYVSEGLVRRLLEAPPAYAVAARASSKWQPFFARYDASEIALHAFCSAFPNQTSLQFLLDDARAVELPLSDAEREELRDWDTPEDIAR